MFLAISTAATDVSVGDILTYSTIFNTLQKLQQQPRGEKNISPYQSKMFLLTVLLLEQAIAVTLLISLAVSHSVTVLINKAVTVVRK